MSHASPELLHEHALEVLAELVEERAQQEGQNTAEEAALNEARRIVEGLQAELREGQR